MSQPCTFLGLVDRTQGTVRNWRQCRHPDLPLGPVVCRCLGCGPACRGYAEHPDADWDPELDDAPPTGPLPLGQRPA